MRVTHEIITLGFNDSDTPSYNLHYQEAEDMNPSEFVLQQVKKQGTPVFLHSTSWRYEKETGLILTWVTFLQEKTKLHYLLTLSSITHGSSATNPEPEQLSIENVISHAVRHLALLLETDTVFAQSVQGSNQILTLLNNSKAGLAGQIK